MYKRAAARRDLVQYFVYLAENENFLVFYLPRSDGISVVRVLYAARDWGSLLGMV